MQKVKLIQEQNSQKQVPGLNVDKKVLRMANGRILILNKTNPTANATNSNTDVNTRQVPNHKKLDFKFELMFIVF